MGESCCSVKPKTDHNHGHNHDNETCHDHDKSGFDIIMHGSLSIIIAAMFSYVLAPQVQWLHDFTYAIVALFHDMWWGLALGIMFIGLMNKIPREYFSAMLGSKDNLGGLFRATLAGLVLDLCNHGILMVAAKLYERGVSLAKVMTFMIASPWNSLSLTFILIALVGMKWTLIYIAGSAVIAFATGLIYAALVKSKHMPDNPNSTDLPTNFSLTKDAKERLKTFKADKKFWKDITIGSLPEARMLIRWLLLGVVMTAAIRAFVPAEMFTGLFGPTFLGLLATLGVTTILEVCSEGSAPIAAEIVNKAKAPGNGFAFLMAGVATDYTEMMIIKEFSKSWWVAFSLPLITVPQILFLGWIMNLAGM